MIQTHGNDPPKCAAVTQEAEANAEQGLDVPRKARKGRRRSSTSKGKAVGKLSPPISSFFFYYEIWNQYG